MNAVIWLVSGVVFESLRPDHSLSAFTGSHDSYDIEREALQFPRR